MNLWLPVLLGWLSVASVTHAQNRLSPDFSAQPSVCKTSQARRPVLKAEMEARFKGDGKANRYDALVADFDGDGWCDFALQVPYPINSKMASYWLEDMLVLGKPRGWRSPLHGKKSWSDSISSLDVHVWPTHQVDLTDIVMLTSRLGGAPYVLGIGPDGHGYVGWGCREYVSVHRWDKEVDAFKKVDDATRDAVLAFYYSTNGQRCERPKK